MQFKFKMFSAWVNLQWWWHAVIALITGRISQKMSIAPLTCSSQNGAGKFCLWCSAAVMRHCSELRVLLPRKVHPVEAQARNHCPGCLMVEVCLSLGGLRCFFLRPYGQQVLSELQSPASDGWDTSPKGKPSPCDASPSPGCLWDLSGLHPESSELTPKQREYSLPIKLFWAEPTREMLMVFLWFLCWSWSFYKRFYS